MIICAQCLAKASRIDALEATVGELLGQPMVTVAGLSNQQMRVAHLLAVRGRATKDGVALAAADGDWDRVAEVDPRMIGVVIHHIRRKLAPYGIEIETLWSQGFVMPLESKRRFMELVARAREGRDLSSNGRAEPDVDRKELMQASAR